MAEWCVEIMINNIELPLLFKKITPAWIIEKFEIITGLPEYWSQNKMSYGF